MAHNRWLNRVIQLELEGNPVAEQLGQVSLSERCRMYCSLAPSVYTCLVILTVAMPAAVRVRKTQLEVL